MKYAVVYRGGQRYFLVSTPIGTWERRRDASGCAVSYSLEFTTKSLIRVHDITRFDHAVLQHCELELIDGEGIRHRLLLPVRRAMHYRRKCG